MNTKFDWVDVWEREREDYPVGYDHRSVWYPDGKPDGNPAVVIQRVEGRSRYKVSVYGPTDARECLYQFTWTGAIQDALYQAEEVLLTDLEHIEGAAS